MPLVGFSIGSSDNGDVGRSLDDIIADRRKEQARAVSGRPSKDKQSGTRAAKEKKAALADRSIATGRAKRAAATRARRGLGDKKASAVEIEKEVYRQSRKTAAAKKASEKKTTNGRVPPNSSLREKKNAKAKKNSNDPPGALVGKMPQAKQVKAAIQGMELAGCPVPKGFQLVMQFSPVAANGKGKGKQSNANSNNNKNNNNTGNQKAGGRRKSGGRGRNN